MTFLDAATRTPDLASEHVSQVDALALRTGRDPVPPRKADVGYCYVADKFARAGLSAVPSDLVAPPRVAQCPVAMEARVSDVRELVSGGAVVVEVEVLRVHVHETVRMDGYANRIDPDRWRPLIMSFQRFYGLGAEVHPSRLSSIDESWYR